MYPTLKQFVEALKKHHIEVLEGENLLAGRAVKGIQIVEGLDDKKNIEYGDILLLSGVGLDNIEENLLSILEEIKNKDAALVLRIGRYIKIVPEKVRLYCKESRIVLLAMDESVKLQPIIKNVYAMIFAAERNYKSEETMMRNLIDGRYSSLDAEKAYRLGFGENNYFVAAVLIIDNFFEVKEKRGVDGFRSILLKIVYRLSKLLQIKNREMKFSLIENNDIVVFIKNEGEYPEKKFFNTLYRELKLVLQEDGERLMMSMGVSTVFSQLSECRKCVIEAERSLQILYSCQKKDMVRYYEDLGVYRLLFGMQDQEETRNIMNNIIGRLKEYDFENHENLTETLRIYLENDKNIGVSANQMYVHRNTLKYRLNKIEEILQCDLSDVNISFNLRFAYKIDCFLKSEKNYYD